MASTYSPLLRIELIGSGEQAGLWGSTTNNNLGTLIEQAIAGVGSITLTSSADYVLTSLNGAPDNARNAVLTFSGSPGATTNIVIPASQKLYVVRNGTGSGGAGNDLIFKTSSQTGGVTVKAGDATLVFCDGASALPGIATANVGTISVSGGGTGVATFTAGVVKSPGGTTALTTGAVALGSATEVSGTLGVANGGTGVGTLTANGLLIGNGVSAVTSLVGTVTGQGIQWNGTSWVLATAATSAVTSFNGRNGAVSPLATDYASFYPLLNGVGATGTWGISITGNAATASTATTATTATTASTAITCTGNAGTVTNGVYTNNAQTITGVKQFAGGIYGGGVSGSSSGTALVHDSSNTNPVNTGLYDGRSVFYQNGNYGAYVGAAMTVAVVTPAAAIGSVFTINRTDSYYQYFTFGSSPFTSGGTNATGYIGSNDGVSTQFFSFSDYRLKTVIGNITDAVARLKQLKPIRFKWKANDALAPVDGFLAHEVQAVVPNAVGGTKDATHADGSVLPQALDTSFLVPLLTAALQNALSRIEALEAKVGI
jgi:hypothetical protein